MFRAMTDHSADLTADLDATGIDVEKAKMSRSEAGRVAANARWGNKGGSGESLVVYPKEKLTAADPKRLANYRRAAANAKKNKTAPPMYPGGDKQMSIDSGSSSLSEQKSNARSKAGMQGARTRAQNKEATASEGAEQEAMATGGRSTRTPGSIQAEMERAGVPKKTIDAITKNPLGSASARETASHIKRVKDVNGLSSKQKVKYNEKMDMPTPGMSPDMKHQDAIVHALNPKSPTRAAAGRKAAEARFGDKGKASSSAIKERRAKDVAELNPVQQAKYKERMAEKYNMPPSKSFPASPSERRHQDALIVALNYKAPKVKRPKKFS